MELTIQTAIPFRGDPGAEVSVHFLRSKDGYMYGLCFKKQDTSMCEVLWYGPRDPRGAVSCLVPPESDYTQEVDRRWNTKAIIRKSRDIDHTAWSESAYMYTITSEQYGQYQKWLLEWTTAAGQYSLIEGGSTSRLFMTATMDYFAGKAVPVFVLKQCVTTLVLEYDSKEPVSVVDITDSAKWYKSLHNTHPLASGGPIQGDVDAVIQFIRSTSIMYYREIVGGVTRRWKLTGVKVRQYTAPLHHVDNYPDTTDVRLVQIPEEKPSVLHNAYTVLADPCPPPTPTPPPLVPITDPNRSRTIVIVILVVLMVIIVIAIVVYIYHTQAIHTQMVPMSPSAYIT